MVAVYEDGKKAGGKRSLSDASAASRDPRTVVWISLVEPSREELDSVARQFELQELAQEDTETHRGVILKSQGRGLTFMVSPARYLDDSGTVEVGELDVLLEEGLAITVLRGEGPNFHDVEQGLEGDGRVTNRLYEPSREVARFQRVTQHLEAVLEGLAHRGSQEPGSNSELGMRLGVARSRARWINSRVSEFVGLLQNLFNANLTLVSVKQSDQTRRISAWAAIIAVPTVI